jgi:signal transduction histidine kinase
VNNALRHARAANLWIGLAERDGTVELSVRDDGVGCGELATGNGLTGMCERAQAHGGTFTASGEPGRGFQVIVTLPREAAP